MRTVVHLSDLHFGRASGEILEPLAAAVHRTGPDLVILSGDLTQDAKDREFQQARAFIETLPGPRLVVPGNHDLPFFNIARRFLSGLDGYRRWITEDLEPFYADDEMAVMGVNTARLWPVRGGRINERQVARVQERMCGVRGDMVHILVTHHPFDLHEVFSRRRLVGRARMALARLATCIDLLLAGHMHIAHAGHTAAHYRLDGHSLIFVQAGTAASRWIRGEPNSFNVVRIDRPVIAVERFTWRPEFACFNGEESDRLHLGAGGDRLRSPFRKGYHGISLR